MRVSLWSKYAVAAIAALIAVAVARPAVAQLGQVETQARQMILMDYDTGTVIFEKNADELMPPSSMSKLMTAYMVYEQIEAGKLRLDDMLPVSEKAWRIQGSKMFVPLGGRVKVEDLLRGVIVQSGNDACIVLAEGIAGTEERFAEMMTERARQLGLTNSTFRNASGWPDPQHLMTARDLASLAKLLISRFPQHYHFYSEKEFTYGVDQVTKKPITQGNRNPLLYKDIGADGLKTGHTEAAGYGLTASVKRGDRRLILVFNGLKSMNERSREAERLIELGFSQFENYKLFSARAVVDEADVWLGNMARVPLVIDRNLAMTLPRQSRGNFKVTVSYDNPIPAPIAKGTPVAKLTVMNRDTVVSEVPLLAGADVQQLGFTGRISAAISYLLWGAKK
ncbi:D-alanyl-D-alanine carboxypeptidase family protein [Ferrovibrio sp.]|uniref:D-alanyl-D-alanine carboxypeptidase family protein n=1 Tax=Ferrovibrio sp. TaxID=1917215 RepID=UPI000CB53EBA|nr:D-alanyl-D-alanine carboxypeptidase family protein [Ferrovibrio sp.]PJI38130.1 MAG: D-alanyl-D-alanine carboxypeptidase [Ferrovibrio sp.]